MEKNLWYGRNCKKYPLNSETVGIQTCGEIPMDINLFLGHWKDSRKYKIEKVEDRKSKSRAFKSRITGTNAVFSSNNFRLFKTCLSNKPENYESV